MDNKEVVGFNNTKNRSLRQERSEQGWKSELVRREQESWKKNVLGAEIEVRPLPDYLTPEVQTNLERFGFDLRYIPRLELGTIDDIRRRGVDQYLKKLERNYPTWKPFEGLSDREKHDHSVPRNLEQRFWEGVKDGFFDFPALPGQWMAVETVEKPAYRRKYARTPFTDLLGIDDRFDVSWNYPKTAIDREKSEILSKIGLARGADLRFLEILEWNLIGNREGWGQTNTYELTNTGKGEPLGPSRLIVGNSDYGGVAGFSWDIPDHSLGRVGFRAAVVFGS